MPIPMVPAIRLALLISVVAGAAVSTQTPMADQPVRAGGDVKQPTKIKDVAAQYPAEAVRKHVQGLVWVEFTVDTTGHVEAARVIRGVPLLDQAALDAVKQWEFTPPLVNGLPRPVILTAEVSFTLGGGNRSAAMSPDASLLSDEEARRQPFLIAPGRVGLLQVGMTVDRLLRLMPSGQTTLVDLQFEGHFTPGIAIRLNPSSSSPSLIVAYRQFIERAGEWRVAVIEVMDPRFRTADGLGVGSTLAEIRAIDPAVAPTFGGFGPAVSLRDRAMSFRLEAPGAARGGTVADTAVVNRIEVRGGPFPQPSVPPGR
jgi:TonB family protein